MANWGYTKIENFFSLKLLWKGESSSHVMGENDLHYGIYIYRYIYIYIYMHIYVKVYV
jgi:hypothetical protein